MSAALDEVMNAVRNERDVVQSAVALLNGLAAKLVTAANQNDSAALEQLAADIRAQTGELAAAVAQNTPSDPAAPQPQPETTPTPIDRSGVDAGPVTVTETNAAGEDTKSGTLTDLPPEHASTVDDEGSKVPEVIGLTSESAPVEASEDDTAKE